MVLSSIVDSINKGIATELEKDNKKFGGYKLFGITELTMSGKQTFPACFLNSEGAYAGVDSNRPLIIYHRANTVNVGEDAGRSYGDLRSQIAVNTYQLQMIVYANVKKICSQPDDLLIFLQSVFPEQVKIDNFEQVNLKIVSAILNKQQVFGNEYKSVKYFLTPELSLFSVNYTIEGRFKKTCFNRCLED